MAKPSHFEIAGMLDIKELVFAARCRDRRCRREEALRLITEEAQRRVNLQLTLEICSRVSRPSGLLAALKFAGPLTKAEIRHVLNELPGRALQMDYGDSDGGHVDLALNRLSVLGFKIRTAKAARLAPDGNIREFVTYELGAER